MSEVIEYGEDFKNLYASAKVRSTEVLCAKGMIVLPMFTASIVDDSYLDSDMTIKGYRLSQDELKGTGYSEFEFVGLTLNAENHLSFWRYINALSQKVGASRILVSVKEMLPFLRRSPDDYHTYKTYFEEFLNRIELSRVRYTIRSNGHHVSDTLLGKIEKIGDGIYSINLGGFMVDTLLKDTFTHKLSIHKHDDIKGGTARILQEKLEVMIFKSCGEFTVDMLFNVLKMKKKTKAERDNSMKYLNKAIQNLKDVGFIVSCEDDKKGTRGIVAKKFIINRSFDKSVLDSLPDEPVVIEQPSERAGRLSVLPPVESIEAMFERIGVNPDSLPDEQAVKREAVENLNAAFAKKLTNKKL